MSPIASKPKFHVRCTDRRTEREEGTALGNASVTATASIKATWQEVCQYIWRQLWALERYLSLAVDSLRHSSERLEHCNLKHGEKHPRQNARKRTCCEERCGESFCCRAKRDRCDKVCKLRAQVWRRWWQVLALRETASSGGRFC